MAQVETIPGYGASFRSNLPSVPQNSVTCHGTKNLLENLNSIVVPPNTYLPVEGHRHG